MPRSALPNLVGGHAVSRCVSRRRTGGLALPSLPGCNASSRVSDSPADSLRATSSGRSSRFVVSYAPSRTIRLARWHARTTCVLMTETICSNISTACPFRRFRSDSTHTRTHRDRIGAPFRPIIDPSSAFKTHSLTHRGARASGSLLTTLSKVPGGQIIELAPALFRRALPIKI